MKNNKETARMRMLAGLITEGQYKELTTEASISNYPGEKSDLIDYTADITTDEIDYFGELIDGVFEVESGNDAMADLFDDIYDSEATGMSWWEDEDVTPFLGDFYDYLLNKAVKEKYGDDVEIETA
jgi:hypothetical protein